MTCEESSRLLPGYFDGELDLVHTLEIEEHVRGCAACSRALEGDRALRSAFTRADLRFAVPARLEKNVRAAVSRAMPKEFPPRKNNWQWAFATAAMALFAVLAWRLLPIAQQPGPNAMAEEAIANHIRSLMPGHLSDVESTDQHTVKPWFDGRVDFSPPVENFAGQGFPLIGGRLDYLGHRPAAALVYQRRKHYINVFLAPAPGKADGREPLVTSQGYSALAWTRGAMSYWVVSDLNPMELEEFASLLRGER
jgi:anti-sigma factor RsiW